ncbi:unnamed protein product [Chrysodeixis includens]|uniref:Uncharacterized protein n=1 Tax=Chrysodeixis includens TaxID=689277 RepID=A0A9P0BXA1_CHRIL|nr:unnamed protein product [Chrysodeixis includens]
MRDSGKPQSSWTPLGMSVMVKRWYRSRRNQFIIFTIILLCIVYYISLHDSLQREPDLDMTRSSAPSVVYASSTKPLVVGTDVKNIVLNENDIDINNRNSVLMFIENRLEEALKEDKGTGCEIPQLDPFAHEVTQFDKTLPKVQCTGRDWVRCYLSECRVIEEVLSTTKDVVCAYQDIIYHTDNEYVLGPPTEVVGGDPYILDKSDHVKIKCRGTHDSSLLKSRWIGHAVGFRKSVERLPSPPYRKDTPNVLIFGFDSTSKNGFIRKMPKSYQYIMRHLEGTLLEGYNIVGDGTPAALFPILTGKNELELPDVRKKMNKNGTADSMPFIFYKLKEDGYRTAYFEDMPWIGTFQYRFNGFKKQPADHYLRAFYLEESNQGKKWWAKGNKYCVGDTPQYQLMMNITDQFLRLDGKKFCFTFIADITHDDFNMISTADEAFVEFLKGLKARNVFEDTMLIIMGDHGPRYAKVRDTLQGKLEERLPLMYIQLPASLRRATPHVPRVLAGNARALSTPHDAHATVLHVLKWLHRRNMYKVKGADLLRGLSLLEPIPRNRSCSEAGIEPHWCACLAWKNVSQSDALYTRTAEAFVAHINRLTEPMRTRCVPRTLTSIQYVQRQAANTRMLSFVAAKDADGYVGKFGARVNIAKENFQLKVVVGPGHGIYEAMVTYYKNEDKFAVDNRDISRTNAYGNEPSCVSASHPHLNMFCYCKEYLNQRV